jgi:MFS superfamily sulfate permease-like transporter
VVPLVGRSALSVSGPAAGLAAIVGGGVAHLGFDAVCAATMIAGAIQVGLGLARAGFVTSFVPSSVIRGMLFAIGLLLILKQVPHAVGYDHEAFDADAFFVEGEGNTFSLLARALGSLEAGAVLLALATIALVVTQRRTAWKRLTWLPAPLVVVMVATLANLAWRAWAPALALGSRHLVDVPDDVFSALHVPPLAAFARGETWSLGVILAIVASLESLLSLEAVDRLDPDKRRSDPDRELLAQGLANLLSGGLGGLPVTSVIVRSSTNVSAGGKSRASAFLHGVLLLVAALWLGPVLRQVPLAALATLLVITGFELAHPRTWIAMWRRGTRIFTPFFVTIVAIVFSDLLVGILVGIAVGLAFTLREAMRGVLTVRDQAGTRTIVLAKDAYFFHKAQVLAALHDTPPSTRHIVVDRGTADFISEDVREAVTDFEPLARARGVSVEVRGVPRASVMPGGH